ncbi:50S ribosomal protein L23 [Candidatus Parvarchaeota archaeon]|jgi:large subunit ribosomal protein L23|uniref:Large ribosomal subunit protein uL23 n=1 Tax=Candidatus Acidifodinimicrobium mancum TaxID=2898728 RepID=A0A8T3UQR4_9ARCH|nr:50S ribosomal protein L23 [Candidatus Acidifodinimicrobium mancum]
MEKRIKNILSLRGGEKAMRLMQQENKLSFIVKKGTNKIELKKEIEAVFSVKIESINVINRMDGDKVAIVKLNKENNAMDLATQLGLI